MRPVDPHPRSRSGSPELDRRIAEVLAATGADADLDILTEILTTAALLAGDGADTLDLKIAAAALREMREAYRTFAPYRDVPKVTIFGSARTRPDDPLYAQAKAVAEALARDGWMVITGAGPGIMAAGMEGAGRERSLGVSIRLPFEQGTNPVIAGDDKLVSMKYFFTRKLMLVKESMGFVCLPGGFGTLDETFELLTLTQTGKGAPVPIVFLDIPGGTYWRHADRFVRDELLARNLVSSADLSLYLVTDHVTRAAEEITGFYRTYHSQRFVGPDLVLRLRREPGPAEVAQLNERFAHLLAGGGIEPTTALPAEVADDDFPELPRLKLRLARRHVGELRGLIDALNQAG